MSDSDCLLFSIYLGQMFFTFTSYLAVFGSSLKTIYLLIITNFMAMLLAFLIFIAEKT